MEKVNVTFHKCIENSNEICNNDNCISSKLIFSINDGNEIHKNLECIVKQYKGCPTDGEREITVSFSDNTLNIDYDKLTSAAIEYYNKMSGYLERATQLVSDITYMYNNNIVQDKTYEIPMT